MLYRIEHLGDRRARFDACCAHEATGRPADFLVSEYPYYHELLNRKDRSACGALDERRGAVLAAFSPPPTVAREKS